LISKKFNLKNSDSCLQLLCHSIFHLLVSEIKKSF